MRSHIIHKQATRKRFEIAPHETFSTDLMFTTEKATRYKVEDRFHLKIHVSIPGQVDIRERKDIEVLHDIKTSAPMITMVEKLGFHAQPHVRGDDSVGWNQWIMYPASGLYNTLEDVLLTVTEQNDGSLLVDLEFRMRENPGMTAKGISRDITYSFQVFGEHVLDPEGNIALDQISNIIYSKIREATHEFDEVLIVERR
jgi:hypothetical protein